jgi:biopolymer transport protein ExbD
MKQSSIFNKLRKPSEAVDEEIDVDVRPMMNVLIILIPFLVSVAVYTRLSILELSLPPNVGAGTTQVNEKPRLKTTVVLAAGYLGITYGEAMLDSIPCGTNGYDYTAFTEKIKLRRLDADVKDEVVVAVKDEIAFKYVVRIMDICRETGFEKMGLAAATDQPDKGE